MPAMAGDELDDFSGVPRYLQIAHAIEDEIRAGAWEPRAVAPSRRTISERYGVAMETAAKAQRWLVAQGYLASVPGVGMVVTRPERWPEK